MTAGNYDITIEQGATFSRVLTWKDGAGSPVNLTGYTARLKVRDSFDPSAELLSLTTENGRIALGGSAGTITLQLTATETAALAWRAGNYDLELVSAGGVVTRLLAGIAALSREQTR